MRKVVKFLLLAEITQTQMHRHLYKHNARANMIIFSLPNYYHTIHTLKLCRSNKLRKIAVISLYVTITA